MTFFLGQFIWDTTLYSNKQYYRAFLSPQKNSVLQNGAAGYEYTFHSRKNSLTFVTLGRIDVISLIYF